MASLAKSSIAVLGLLSGALAQQGVLDKPGQPSYPGQPGVFEIVGNSGVSAQQMFLGTENTVYIVDKTEGNPLQVGGHPAWATEYRTTNNSVRPMQVLSNTFCAGGASLGDGRWINVGGNQGITVGGVTPTPYPSVAGYGGEIYNDYDGGKAVRILTPCDDASCDWIDDPKNYMTTRRWYPWIETLEDGSVIIIGGDLWGGYVNSAGQNNPTYEFYPTRGNPVHLQILEDTLPANLFPLTWLLPSKRLFIQTGFGTEILDYNSGTETKLPDIPYSVRAYPQSGATVLLPLTPANNYELTMIFCGGNNLTNWDDTNVKNDIAHTAADSTCVRITPEGDAQWHDDTPLPEGRTMGQFILLPDGNLFLVNGAKSGTAGYGNATWAVGASYADGPILQPYMYFPENKTFSSAGLNPSTVERMYHSTAVLLPDGSVFVSGSNPNLDYTTNKRYNTEYRTERFYPWYYNKSRPEPVGLVSNLTYGGNYFDVSLTQDDLQGDVTNVMNNKTKVVVLRTGFSTHAFNMGQRMIELESSYTINNSSSATIHVSQMPPNSALFPPGPAIVHVVVNGVPSVGKMIMVGSGSIGTQTVLNTQALPSSSVPSGIPTAQPTQTGKGGGSNSGAAGRSVAGVGMGMGAVAVMVVLGAVLGFSA